MGITEKEALKQLIEDDLGTMAKVEERFKRLDERLALPPSLSNGSNAD
jgi:hypothetical protein